MEVWIAVADAEAGKFSSALSEAGEDFDLNAQAPVECTEIVPYATTLLVLAVEKKSLECVQLLLSAGADANTATGVGDTPLIAACRTTNLQIVQALLAAGADPALPQQPPAGAPHTPLSAVSLAAGDAGDPEVTAAIVDALLQAGATPTPTYGPGGLTPVHILARAGAAGIPALRCLLKGGANVDHPTGNADTPFTPLQWAALSDMPGAQDAVGLLLEFGAEVNPPPALLKVLEAPLVCAAACFHAEAFQALLAKGADINQCSYTKHSVLDFACRALTADEQAAAIRIVRCILRHPQAGAVKGIKGPSKKSPLLTAVRAGFSDAVHELLLAGMDGSEVSEGGEPLLVVAAELQSPGVMEALLLHGADVHAKVTSSSRETALLTACRCPAVPLTQRARASVFQCGTLASPATSAGAAAAAVTPAPADGVSPFDTFTDLWASCSDAGELMVRMLLRRGANVGTVCAFKGGVLHRVALGGNLAAGQALMEHAVETGKSLGFGKDELGRTPADVCVQQDSHELLEVFLEHPATRDSVLSAGASLAPTAFTRKNWRSLMALLARPEVAALRTSPAACDEQLLLPGWATANQEHPFQLNYEGQSWCTFLTVLAHRSPLVAPYTGALGVPMCAVAQGAAGAHEGDTVREQHAQLDAADTAGVGRSWWVPSFVRGLMGDATAVAAAPASAAGRTRGGGQLVDLTRVGLFKWQDSHAGSDARSKQCILSALGARRVLGWLAVFPSGFNADSSAWGDRNVALVTLMTYALILALDRQHRLQQRAAAAAAAAGPGAPQAPQAPQGAAAGVPACVLQALPAANWRLRRSLVLNRQSLATQAGAQ